MGLSWVSHYSTWRRGAAWAPQGSTRQAAAMKTYFFAGICRRHNRGSGMHRMAASVITFSTVITKKFCSFRVHLAAARVRLCRQLDGNHGNLLPGSGTTLESGSMLVTAPNACNNQEDGHWDDLLPVVMGWETAKRDLNPSQLHFTTPYATPVRSISPSVSLPGTRPRKRWLNS